MADTSDNTHRALSLLIDKGIFAKGVDVRQLVALSDEVAKLGGDKDLAAWTLINKDYVLTGKALDPSGPVVLGRG
jgi:hypothetical protein